MDAGENRKPQKSILIAAIVFAIAFLALTLIANMTELNEWLKSVLLLFRPILIGLAIAYLTNPFFRFFERKVLYRVRPAGLRRALSLVLSYLLILFIIVFLLFLILPQLIDSIASFAVNYKAYVSSGLHQVNQLIEKINGFIANITGNAEMLEQLDETTLTKKLLGDGTQSTFWNQLANINIKPLTEMLSNTVLVITDALFGFFVSLYLLCTKEKRYAQVMKLRHALFNDATNERITRFCSIMDRSFGSFLEGKLIDALIVSILIYVVLSIMNLHYALLIATFIGVTSIIPVVGILIGAIPTALIILLTDPGKLLLFLLILVLIQQLDSNVITPKILGNNTGVSSLCVLIAISVMGAVWGLIGMLLAVPLAAAILEMTDELMISRLQKKGLPSGVESYYATDALVNPGKSARATNDKTAQKMERAALLAQKKLERREPLSRTERIVLRIDRFAHKHHIITEISDEGQIGVAAEEIAKAAEKELNELTENDEIPVETAEAISVEADENTDSVIDTATADDKEAQTATPKEGA